MSEQISTPSTAEEIGAPASPEIVVIGLIAVVVGVATRFITRSGLWLDEALTVNIANLPLDQITGALEHDGHPPLYYFLLHFWTGWFGTGDVAARSMSGLFGILCLPLVWILGRRKGGTLLAWVAVAVVALSPFAVRYSDEARMYSLVMLLVFIGWVLLDDIVSMGRATIARFIALAVVSAALLYTHYWGLWLLAAVGIVMLWRLWRLRAVPSPERRAALGVVLALVAAGIAFVPWVPTMLYQGAHTGTPWASPMRPTSALAVTLADLSAGSYGEQTLVAVLTGLAIVLGVFGYAVNATTTSLDLRGRPQFRREAFIASLAFIIGCVVSFALKGTYASRYGSVIFPILALLVAAGLTRFSSRWIRSGVVAVMCAFLAIGAMWNIRDFRTQVKSIGAVITSSSMAGDVVVTCPDQLGPATTRVVPDSVRIVTYPDLGDGTLVDWVDYGDRNRASDPIVFADAVLAMAGTQHDIFMIVNGAYKTFENKCEAVLAHLGAARPGEYLAADDGEHFFEHAALVRFPAPR